MCRILESCFSLREKSEKAKLSAKNNFPINTSPRQLFIRPPERKASFL